MIVSMITGAVAVISHASYQRCRPPRSFGIFLCHCKAGSGILCRFLKLPANKHSSSRIFLDSDALESLDQLYDTVRCRTKNLVVILTQEALCRMWCAGEIVTAHANRVPILPIVCEGYTHPSSSKIDDIGDVWTRDQQHTLMSFGISVEMIQAAYRELTRLPCLSMPRFGTVLDQENVVVEMLTQCKLPKRAFMEKWQLQFAFQA
ncbi:unnamed protein product [Polarella glacialis]|uniref:TIR domain-containing protein n=1 Tax=Polarella glacialis TaxID=89957 RepID=A0A813H269_POLGL|nr:unnamed protein product [Polarella glacialis]